MIIISSSHTQIILQFSFNLSYIYTFYCRILAFVVEQTI